MRETRIYTRMVCNHCDYKLSTSERNQIEAMQDAGFALRHLACPACGQQDLAIIDNKEG